MPTVDMLEQELRQKKLHSIYALYGEETYLLETNVNRIKKLFGEKVEGINYVVLDENTVDNLLKELQTPPFGYEKKLIIVKNTGILKKEAKKKSSNITQLQEKISDYIEKNEQEIEDSIILVIIDEKADKTKLLETITKHGVVCQFEKLKPIEIVKRLKLICSQYKVNVSEKTLNKLIETSGTSMQILINEIRKLIEYAGENGTINDEDIDKLAIKQIDSVIFNLTDYLGNKNIKKSLEILYDLLYLKEPIQMILITLYRHFKKLYLVKLAQAENQDIAQTLQLKPNQMFLITKYKKQAEYFTTKDLRQMLKKLTELDTKSKTGQIDLNIGLEAVLCSQIG